MKLINPGKLEPVKYQATCRNCGAVIEATKDELNIQYCSKEMFSFAHEHCIQCESKVVFYKK
ncbi:hypothetical protein [Pseudoalteromonas sp.]|uniref:hypothetical protein n=1 Tax=Pseudoalteromonas sp. TaxID=53249 RepID=UPI003D0D85D4